MLFVDTYRFLSNGYMADGLYIDYEGIRYPSAEHMYQALKTDNVFIRNIISELKTPTDAIMYWRTRATPRIDKIELMTIVINTKFNIPSLSMMLASVVGDIVYDSLSQDMYFGVFNESGHNHLGKLLMAKRDSILSVRSFMREKVSIGNLYTKAEVYDYLCFTSNSTLKSNNNLVMGKGNALAMSNLYPKLSKELGKEIANLSEYNIMVSKKYKAIAIQTKDDWMNDSTLEMVERSIEAIFKFAKENPKKKIGMPIPGISNGGLSIFEVIPLLLNKPDNIDIWRLPTMVVAGIGSRELPSNIEKRMNKLIKAIKPSILDKLTIAHGDAKGSDLKWKSLAKNEIAFLPTNPVSREAIDIAGLHHPYFKTMKPFTKMLMGRNVYQVMGHGIDTPVDCVLCYTKDGAESRSAVKVGVTGGTGLAISVADAYDIPVFNVANISSCEEAIEFINNFE